MSESNLVLIPVDGSDHSERAFDCEYELFVIVTKFSSSKIDTL